LGAGEIVSTAKVIPNVNNTVGLGDNTHYWQNVYTAAIRFTDGTSFSSGARIIGATPPLTSKGNVGDIVGKIAFDASYLYYCFATFNGSTDIWKRMPWDAGTW
jgi:hypothetical protein